MIPDLSDKTYTREEIIKKYFDAGWAKQLEFDWVYIGRSGEIRVQRMRFTADSIPCGKQQDVQHMLTFLQLSPAGVVWNCAVCGKTDGPITNEVGVQVSDRVVDVNEAWNILNKTGQIPPIGLQKANQRVRIA